MKSSDADITAEAIEFEEFESIANLDMNQYVADAHRGTVQVAEYSCITLSGDVHSGQRGRP